MLTLKEQELYSVKMLMVKITVARCYNNNGQISKNEKTMDYVAVLNH